jgi:hypothetical protein
VNDESPVSGKKTFVKTGIAALLLSVAIALVSAVGALVGGLVSTPLVVAVSYSPSFVPLPDATQRELDLFVICCLAGLVLEIVFILLIFRMTSSSRAPSRAMALGARITVVSGGVVAFLVLGILVLIAAYTVAPIAP